MTGLHIKIEKIEKKSDTLQGDYNFFNGYNKLLIKDFSGNALLGNELTRTLVSEYLAFKNKTTMSSEFRRAKGDVQKPINGKVK